VRSTQANGDLSGVATGGGLAVSRPSGRRPYVVRVIPLAGTNFLGGPSPTALMVIADPEHEPQPDREALRCLYGLTRNEAEIALRVVDGMGRAPIAEERQAELVRLLPGGLSATRRIRHGDDGD